MMKRHRITLAAAAFALAVTTLSPIGGTLPALVAEETDIVMPEILRQAAPEYPEEERLAGIGGRVVLSAVVKRDGSVGEIEVVEGVPGHPAFSVESEKALRRWLFRPGTNGGEPSEVTVHVPFDFRLEEKEREG